MKQNDHQNLIRVIHALVITLTVSYNLLPFIALFIPTDETTLHVINLTIRALIPTLQHLFRHLQSRQIHLANLPPTCQNSQASPPLSHKKTAPHPRAKPFTGILDLRHLLCLRNFRLNGNLNFI